MLPEIGGHDGVLKMCGVRGGDTDGADVAAGEREAGTGASGLRDVCDGAESGVGSETIFGFHGGVDIAAGE